MEHRDIAVLMPAFGPNHTLNQLIAGLKQNGFERIVVIDDGSGARFAPVFNEAWLQGVRVLYHENHCGQGIAMKTGFTWIGYIDAPACIVCDCGRGHALYDVLDIAQALIGARDALVLGARGRRSMSVKSQWDNIITGIKLALRSGVWIHDTHAGIYGFDARLCSAFKQLPGDRFDYELNMISFAARNQIPIMQVPIQMTEAKHVRPTSTHALRKMNPVKSIAAELTGYVRSFGDGQRL